MNSRGIYNNCIECEDVITNPVCPECLVKEMKMMVGEKNQEIADEIDPISIHGDTNCLRCGENMALCPHCFSKDVYFQIKQRDEKLAREFAQRFDYELRASLV